MRIDQDSEAAPLTREASRWVTQLVSGEATDADAAALENWRRSDPAHEAAFVEAVRVWKGLGASGRAFIKLEGAPSWPGRRRQMTRRVMLGGGAALAAASVGYALVDPPLGLWPSLDELNADYRTATGEQRRVTLTDVTVEMNTQTSIAVDMRGSDIDRVKLIAGQASFVVPQQARRNLAVIAGSGRMVTNRGRFDVRSIGAAVDVTCTDGQVRVEQRGQSMVLPAGAQLRYDRDSIGESVTVDTTEATSWQQGFIVFRNIPLADAIAEVNRYRPGRVILLNSALAATTVSGRFRIERIDQVLAWIEQAAGARPRALPGGIVLLS
jgi:transmembrane sensor